jgi:hypothetical protein
MTMNAGPISIAFEFSRCRAFALPAPRFSASIGLRPARFGLDRVVVAAARAAQTPAAERSTRSAIARRRLRSARLGVQNQNRPRAFPIAANRPAPSLNPAYVRSPSVTHEPTRRAPAGIPVLISESWYYSPDMNPMKRPIPS